MENNLPNEKGSEQGELVKSVGNIPNLSMLVHSTSQSEPSDDSPASVAGDPILNILVNSVNRSENGAMTITLMVPGAIITGNLIGRRDYFRRMGRLAGFDENGDPRPNAQSVASAFNRWAELPDSNEPPQHIHVADAHIVMNDRTAPNEPFLWRGRLSEVSGFLIGRISFGD